MLKIKNIKYQIDGLCIINDVSLDVNRGEIVGLIGPNGSGKTTLFNIINGFLKQNQGDIYLNNKQINNTGVLKRTQSGIGRMWQDTRIFQNMTALENLIISSKKIKGEKILDNFINLKSLKTNNREITESANKYLNKVDLYEKRNYEAGNLSYGQQKLIAIGRLLMNEAELFLLDEPFAGVNYVYIEKIRELIINLKEENKAIIFIEHNIPLAKSIATKMYALDNGNIITEGSPEEVTTSIELKEAYAGI